MFFCDALLSLHAKILNIQNPEPSVSQGTLRLCVTKLQIRTWARDQNIVLTSNTVPSLLWLTGRQSTCTRGFPYLV